MWSIQAMSLWGRIIATCLPKQNSCIDVGVLTERRHLDMDPLKEPLSPLKECTKNVRAAKPTLEPVFFRVWPHQQRSGWLPVWDSSRRDHGTLVRHFLHFPGGGLATSEYVFPPPIILKGPIPMILHIFSSSSLQIVGAYIYCQSLSKAYDKFDGLISSVTVNIVLPSAISCLLYMQCKLCNMHTSEDSVSRIPLIRHHII